MATSPIYGWQEPNDSDLVKNGALAIRTLGDAIDTTMATMTPKSIVDAKGDLIAASAADTPARLAVGNNGETLVADSSTATGLRYTAGTVQANPVINSAMAIFQRGTSVAVTTGTSNNYTADRWALSVGANQASTVSRQATGDTTNLPFIQYCARVQRNSGQTGTGAMNFDQSIETINSIPFVGKTVTVSFYARAGANYSPTSSVLTMQLVTGTGTDQNISTATGVAVAGSTNATLTTTWQRFTFIASIGTSVTQLFLRSANTPTGTAGTNDWYELTGVQIDIGSVALPFRTNQPTYATELTACFRYYQEIGLQQSGGWAGASSTTSISRYHLSMCGLRANPTVTLVGTPQVFDGVTQTNITTINSIGTPSSSGFHMNLNVASGLTQYRPYTLYCNGGTVQVSAEL